MVLKTCGDWPYLAQAGNLDRTFANAVKHADQHAGRMCHLCAARPHPTPFEEIGTRHPSWRLSADFVFPFKREPSAACLETIPSRLAEHFAFDVSHTFHLGIGKSFLGSVLARLSDLETGNVEERFDKLTFKYHSWCRAESKSAMVPRLHKDLIQWATTSDYPAASWFKGAFTTNLMEFFESLDGSFHDDLLQLAMEGVKAINRFFRILYSEDAWLSPEEARLTGELACRFLRRYEACAKHAFHQQRTLFAVLPNCMCCTTWPWSCWTQQLQIGKH